MEDVFSRHYDAQTDQALIDAARAGSRAALEALIGRHQHFIYNVALKFVLSPFDAEDLTQEVLIKVVTNLAQFRGESQFRTWLYRIVFNHFRQLKPQWLETAITSFADYSDQLRNIPDQDLTALEQAEWQEFVTDAKWGCMSGMLLCLDREQRLAYVLGEIFGADHRLGASLLSISPANFRQRLARARKDLYHFMNRQCGLVNPDNPCRCARKTKGFIQAGWVDADRLKFNTAYYARISEISQQKATDLDTELETTYAALFRDHPFQEKEHRDKLLAGILQDKRVRTLFDLDPPAQ